MIMKIISGGQTGAERAALDVALKLGIPHGGWVPKGRKTDGGILPEKYKLKELKLAGYPSYSGWNVIDSDGTLILSHGKLMGGSVWPLELTNKHNRPCLHIDLNEMTSEYAVPIIRAWMIKHRLEVLNVTGSRASKDQRIYSKVFKIIEVLYRTTRLGNLQDTPGDKPVNDVHHKKPPMTPKTTEEAVDRLLYVLPLKVKSVISKMSEDDLTDLRYTLGIYIRNQFRLNSGNRKLLDHCRLISQDKYLHHSQAPEVIIRELWKKLKETHKLRVVK